MNTLSLTPGELLGSMNGGEEQGIGTGVTSPAYVGGSTWGGDGLSGKG